MATLYDAPTDELLDELAEELADRIEEPEWAQFTKTGSSREMPPEQDDFWYKRAASLLRKIAVNGPVGVGALESEYGSTKRGSNRYQVRPANKVNASGNIIRTIIQQLEDEDLVQEKANDGRVVTGEGRSLLDTTAGDVLRDLDRDDLERYV